jgi:hypothetical protein
MAMGLTPAYHYSGGVIRAREYTILSTYNTNIFNGDPVILATTGLLQIGADGDNLVGVFAGVSYKASNGEYVYSRYWPANTAGTEIKAFVFDDPNIVYIIESDQDTTPLAQAQVGETANFGLGTGSTVTGQSAAFLDSSTSDAVTAFPLRVLGSAEVDGGFTAAGTPMDVYVQFARHFTSDNTGI